MAKKRRLKKKVRLKLFKSKLFWISILSFMLIVGLGYTVLFWDLFQVEEVNIRGLERLREDEVLERVDTIISKDFKIGPWNIFSSRGILLFKKQNVERFLKDELLRVGGVRVKRFLPDKIILEINEREMVAEICRKECYQVDKTGFVFLKSSYEKEADEEVQVFRAQDGGLLINLKDSRSLRLGETVVSEDVLSSIVNIEGGLGERLGSAVGIELNEERLTVRTEAGPRLYFNLERDVKNQLANLRLLLSDKLSETDLKTLEYVDLRFGNRVYYK